MSEMCSSPNATAAPTVWKERARSAKPDLAERARLPIC